MLQNWTKKLFQNPMDKYSLVQKLNIRFIKGINYSFICNN